MMRFAEILKTNKFLYSNTQVGIFFFPFSAQLSKNVKIKFYFHILLVFSIFTYFFHHRYRIKTKHNPTQNNSFFFNKSNILY
jgi:hypothetical protein